MKAFVLAEHSDAAQELCAGARTMADEVVLVAIADMEVPAAVADKVLHVALPEGAVVDDAADTVIAAFDAEQPGVVLVEPTRHMKVVAGKVAAHAGASIIPDVIEFDGDVATDMYFGGVGMKKQKATGVAFYGVGAGVFAEAAASGANATEELAWVAPAKAIKLVSSVPVEKSGVDLNKADVVVAAGRGFGAEEDLQMARDLCDKIGGGLGCSVLSPRVSTGFPPRSTLAFPASCSAPRFTSQLASPARCSTWSAATARPRCLRSTRTRTLLSSSSATTVWLATSRLSCPRLSLRSKSNSTS